jgi:hypothetical protein
MTPIGRLRAHSPGTGSPQVGTPEAYGDLFGVSDESNLTL